MEYVTNLLLNFSMMFFLSYYGMLIYYKIESESEWKNHIYGGLIMAAVFAILSIVIYHSDKVRMPDGTFLITGFSAFYFGPVAGIITAAFSSLLTHVLYHNSLLKLLLVQMILIGLCTLLRERMNRKGRHPKGYEIFLFVTVTSALIIGILYLLAKDKTLYLTAARSFFILVPIQSLSMTALLTVNYKETERNRLIQSLHRSSMELAGQKSEIEALYEAIFANEEELQHENALSGYEKVAENRSISENDDSNIHSEKTS